MRAQRCHTARTEGAKYFENSQVEDLENRFATPPAPIVEKVSTTRIAHRSFGSRRPAADGGTARKGSAQCPLAHRVPPYAPTMSDGLRASREPGRETAQTRIQVAPAARHPAAPPTTFTRSPSSILALQRHVGNAAVAALVARAPARRVEKPTTGTPTVQRNGDEAEEPAAAAFASTRVRPAPRRTPRSSRKWARSGSTARRRSPPVAAVAGKVDWTWPAGTTRSSRSARSSRATPLAWRKAVAISTITRASSRSPRTRHSRARPFACLTPQHRFR